MTSKEDHLLDWLRDAHAMERQAETMLTSMAGRLEHYPELKARIEKHADETREQARLLESCLERRGTSQSALKDLAGRTTAMGQGLSGMFVSDEVVKGTMAGYTFEHMEIAAYRSLIAAAEAVGDTATAQVCQTILGQEIEMATWLEEHIPAVTKRFLSLVEQPGATAKH